ncbi:MULTISPECIES: cell division ATP-binding protein FtsE [unclassified Fibrobacter]|uniref:cell division ATP-binding protein FtsE n=1 Tax=unclassified Fibrobacter TaxID=2634177 RepID=UPI00091B459A|nr:MULTISPECIES: cell division ATP-binding protein FtsE [unclassified Fibrobacter]PWJ61739.1 cell division transport system ATP-binding protein [Fibrobacter sp. UWR4]PZW67395.1 cell division ATP-binding protein FtsE [Fibrobacter sp. UWR1]SHK50086.1 cell division ATP-binding protein FtsE [Fibrobacter sp. UWEL]
MIHFNHVTKSYEENWKALSNVSFRIRKGEFVFLTGHSGAGKSTLLKLIYMDERPDVERGGQVMVKFTEDCLYDSKNTADKYIQSLRRKMGIIFQDFKLLPDRNVFENVALALRIVGAPTKTINAAVFDALALVGISQKRFAMPYTLSGGEQQRVAIARAMVHNPYLLLADEPTGNLDPKNAEEVFKIFKEINARGTTVLMATHNPDFYMNSPFRRLTLDHGELLNRDIL